MRGLPACAAAAILVCGLSTAGVMRVAACCDAAMPMAAVAMPTDYAQLVQEYRSGDAALAVEQVAELEELMLRSGLATFMATAPSAELLTAAAAMHAEAALRTGSGISPSIADRHLGIATGMVEIGTPRGMKRLGDGGLKSNVTVSASFRRVFFLAAIASLQYRARTATTDAYLVNARLLFPHDAEVLLFSGIAEEMRGSGRLAPTADSVRRTALGHAEIYLRESLELAPDRRETRLRLGRVLSQRGLHDEARPLLTTVASAPDPRLAYRAALFLGGLEDAAGHADASLEWYERAGTTMPSAQAAPLAASELHHRAGARQVAAETAASAIGRSNADDPWWAYLFGEFWRIEPSLDALREMARK